MIKTKDGYVKLIGTTYSGSADYLLQANGGAWAVHTGRNDDPNKIVRTDASGYLQTGWINTTSGDIGTGTVTRIYCSNDGYIRYKTPANFFSTLANNGNQLSITVGSYNRKLTVGYASSASSAEYLNNYSSSNPNSCYKDTKVKWFAQINNSGGYAGNSYGFPVSNNANGILWLGMHSGNYGHQLGFSSNGYIYNRYISEGSFPTTTGGASWRRIAFITDNVASATTVKVSQHTTNNINYPLVWSNQNNTSTNNSSLYKSYNHLCYNPSTKLLIVSGGVNAGNVYINGVNRIYASSTDTTHQLNLMCEATYAKIQSNGSIPLAINPDGNNVGIGTTAPLQRLHVNGNTYTTGYVSGNTLTSRVATGTAPLTIASTTKVANLNADLLDDCQLLQKGSTSGVMRSWARGTYTTINQYFGNGAVVVIDPKPTDASWTSANTIVLSLGDYASRNTQLIFPYEKDAVFYRRNTGSWSTQKQLAFLDSKVSSATNADNADKLDGIHASGLLTTLTSSSGTNLSITVGGTTKTIADLYATQAVNADTVDNFHATGTGGNALRKSGYLTSGTANLSSYWGKVASFTWKDQYNDQDITLYMHSAYNSVRGIVHIRARWSSTTSYNVNCWIVAGNLVASNLRLYYNPSSSSSTLELWYNVEGRYGVINTSVISETGRTSTETFRVTLYNTLFSTVQTPSLSSYVSGSYIHLYNSVDVANKLGITTIGGSTTPIYLSSGTPKTCSVSSEGTASTIAVRDSSGDLKCRLVRSNYNNQTTISGALAFRVNNSSDNYIRFCSSTSAIRTWLGAAPTSHTHNYIVSRGVLNPQTGRTQNLGNVYSYNTGSSTSTGAPTTYTAVIGFGRSTSGTVEIAGGWTSGMGLWYRALRDTTDNWYSWRKVWDSGNFDPSDYATSGHTHTYYWANVKVSSSSSTSTSPTFSSLKVTNLSNLKGLQVSYKRISSSSNNLSDDDCFIILDRVNAIFYLPFGTKYAGRVICIKAITTPVSLRGNFRYCRGDVGTNFTINDKHSRFFIHDGTYWNEFFCSITT